MTFPTTAGAGPRHRPAPADAMRILAAATTRTGLDSSDAELISAGENTIFRLSQHAVARIARPGQLAAAEREVRIARWFADHDMPAVRLLGDVEQPVDVEGRAVTFWQQLPAHRHGTALEIAAALRRLHDLPAPAGLLAPLDPFVRLAERIESGSVDADTRYWLRERLDALHARYSALPTGLPVGIVHGDAWGGNIVTTDDGRTLLLDLERCSLGPPEWDLVSIAIRRTSFTWLTTAEYHGFWHRYGHDVTTWPGFELLRDIRELRMALYRVQRAAEQPADLPEAQLRIACLRGFRGPRPWDWGR